MELTALCHGIRLQEEARRAALDFWRAADRDRLAPALDLLRHMDTEAQGRAALKDLLGEDRRQYKLLACMLSCGADLYSWYGERGIPDQIYFATMGCFPRFLEECRQITGVPAFDRGWWTARQISGTLFRLGELEYELRTGDGGPWISIHIPSDAALTPDRCGRSLDWARSFFADRFPAWAGRPYLCRSWLLAPELRELLPPESRILAFQRRLRLEGTETGDREYMRWIFRRDPAASLADLPEDTTLQRNLKRRLLEGGGLSVGRGVLA